MTLVAVCGLLLSLWLVTCHIHRPMVVAVASHSRWSVLVALADHPCQSMAVAARPINCHLLLIVVVTVASHRAPALGDSIQFTIHINEIFGEYKVWIWRGVIQSRQFLLSGFDSISDQVFQYPDSDLADFVPKYLHSVVKDASGTPLISFRIV